MQFIDLCIMLGCDYCETIRGIGPVKALELITRHRTIEAALQHIDNKVSLSLTPLPFLSFYSKKFLCFFYVHSRSTKCPMIGTSKRPASSSKTPMCWTPRI